MHLKNFSLISKPGIGYGLAPAYDMVATTLVNPADEEELALTLNGKKRKINLNDFKKTFSTLGLGVRQQQNIFKKMERAKDDWFEFIEVSFISDDFKEALKNLIGRRLQRLR